MLVTEHPLHLFVAEVGRQVDDPVAEVHEEFLSLLILAIPPGIAQAGIHLVQVVERGPRAEVRAEVALLERRPDALAVGHTAHVATSPLRVVLPIGIGTRLQLADHILHATEALRVAHRRVHGQRRQVVTAHMAVESLPIGIGLGFRLEPGLLAIGREQTVAVILQQRLDVQVARLLQRTVKQGDITQTELIVISCCQRGQQEAANGQDSLSHRLLHYYFFTVLDIDSLLRIRDLATLQTVELIIFCSLFIVHCPLSIVH